MTVRVAPLRRPLLSVNLSPGSGLIKPPRRHRRPASLDRYASCSQAITVIGRETLMRVGRAIVRSAALAAALASAGCASRGAPPPPPIVGTVPAGNLGSAWEAVLPPEGAATVGAYEDLV